MKMISGVKKMLSQIGISEVLFIAGVGLAFYGMWRLIPELALIVSGVALVVLGLVFAARGKKDD